MLRRAGIATALMAALALAVAGPAMATSVTAPSLSLSSTSAAAKQVTYTAKFTSTHSLTQNASTVTLTAPAGTVFPAQGCYTVADPRTHQSQCAGATVSAGLNSVKVTAPMNAGAGDPVVVTVNGVSNASTAGGKSLVVSTSSDVTPVSIAFTLTAATAASGASLSSSSTAATATQVTYGIKFKSTNALTQSYSTVTLTATAGTVFSAGGCYTIANPRTNQSGSCQGGTVSSGGNAVTVTVPIPVNAGDPVVVTATAVANASTAGAKTMTLSTTSDPRAVSMPFTLTAVTSVSGASLSLSSTSATASQVTYVAKFQSTNGLTQSHSTLTMTAPAGTDFPGQACAYAIADSRMGRSQQCPAVNVSPGLNSVTITTGINVGAGDPVTVTVNGVSNISTAGARSLTFSTTSDPKVVSMPFTLTAVSSAGAASLSLNSTSATASEVAYVAKFKSTNGFTQGYSTVTLTAPAGTAFPSQGCAYTIADTASGQSSSCLTVAVSSGSNAVTITTGINVGAGQPVTVTVDGVANDATAGAQGVSLSTTSDPKAVSMPFTLTARTAEHGVTSSLSSSAATASQVTYDVSYVATNGLTPGYSTVTVTAPSGTVFPGGGCGVYQMTNSTTGSSANCLSATVSAGSNVVTLVSGITVSPGNVVTITANGVTSESTAGSAQLSLSTSADPGAASAPFTLTAPTREAKVAPSLSSLSATASQVTYGVSYQATNGLTAGFSRVTMTAPAGTVFPPGACGVYVITDETTGNSQSCLTATVSAGSNGVTLVSAINVSAGDTVTVTANGVANTATAGSKSLLFSTTSDPVTVSEPFTLTAPAREGSVTSSLSSYSATASQVTYSVSYAATDGLTAGFSRMTITAPAGTAFPAGGCGVYVETDQTNGNSQNCLTATVSAGSNGVTLVGALNVSPGDDVTITANGVSNAASAGSSALTFDTTSDPVAVSVPFTLTAPTPERDVTLSLSSSSASASEVTYGVNYVAANGLTQGLSRLTLTAPAGTVLPGNNCAYVMTDQTTGASQSCPTATLAPGSGGVTFVSGVNVAAGDAVNVTINGVSNPSTAGSKALILSTTSDPASASVPFTLTAPARERSATLALSSPTASASGVTYTLNYTATNGLTQGYSTLSLTASAGTVFPGGGCGVYVMTDETTGDSQSCLTATVAPGSNAVNLVSGIDVAAGDVVRITADPVRNASTSGANTLAFSTTSDPTAVSVPYTLTAARGVRARRSRARSD